MGGAIRLVKRVALGFILVVGGLALLTVLGTIIPHPLIYSDDGGAPRDKRILLVSNTIHTDIAIPLDPETMSTLAFLADANLPIGHPEARWLLIGWGGRSFYLETPSLAEMKPGPTFRALTLDSSVMHVDVLGEIETTNPAVLEMSISDDAYSNLLWTIVESFALKDGAVQPIEGFAFGTSDKFFEAVGSFNALLGCNVWTSRILRSAGIRTGLWNPIPPSLTASVGLFNRPVSAAASPE